MLIVKRAKGTCATTVAQYTLQKLLMISQLHLQAHEHNDKDSYIAIYTYHRSLTAYFFRNKTIRD